jgi:O-antigen/teichoic acid export membrane protein
VSIGVYAELSGERQKLSEVFFRINALLVRAGFLIAGLMVLISPEFIRLIIGSKWLPTLQALRFLLIFAMLDPIKLTVSHLFVALGLPEKVMRIRLIQLAVLGVGLFSLSAIWGISGVALAVDMMLIVGIFFLLQQAREFVDFSMRKLFLAPTIALIISGLLTFLALQLPRAQDSDWISAFVKIGVFVPAYLGLLFWQERRDVQRYIAMISNFYKHGKFK